MKLENDLSSDMDNQPTIKEDINQANNQYHEELLKNQEAENIVDESSKDCEVSFTQEATQKTAERTNENDLSELSVESDAPDLFNNQNDSLDANDLSAFDNDQEDDLEIPAFLRRQKHQWSSKNK